MSTPSTTRAATFRELHRGAELLVLPNAWDVASARAVERAGASAIATTSSGVAQSLGYPDGNVLPRELAVATVARIAKAVGVPVSADIEAGYGETPDDVADTVEQILEAGAVGVNLEDGRRPPEVLAAKIEAIRKRVTKLGASLYLNARTDPYLLGLDSPLEESLRRAAIYQSAGADGIFVPGIKDPDAIRRVCAEVPLPVNVLLVPGLPSPKELVALGVRRLSAGSAVWRNAVSHAERCAHALLDDGRYDVFFAEA
jgi:2-methylisocitrate lyase-like PEP mutase family enzyme